MCVVTDGRGRPKGDPAQIAAIRRAEAQASADLIGADLVWLAVPLAVGLRLVLRSEVK